MDEVVSITVIEAAAEEGREDAESRDQEESVSEDHRFELRDIDVLFPEGELTVVTGPTASGKTALLVSFRPPVIDLVG